MEDDTPNVLLRGHEAAALAFAGMASSQRLHHAWLLTGEQGIGKATFAWQAAAYLLNGQDQQGSLLRDMAALDGLHAAANSQAANQMRAGSHPDFRYVVPDPAKAKSQISIEQIRTMASMFVTTAGMGGWRVAIIDAAEDMNRNAANAILKLLEEPPEKCLFFLISHAPGRLLPTIRSRCSTVAFSPLDDADARAVVQDLRPDADAADLETVLGLAQGSPGKALSLLDANAADYVIAIDQIFADLPVLDKKSVNGLAGLAGDRAATGVFEVLWSLIEERISFAIKDVCANAPQALWTQSLPLGHWLSLQESLADRKGQTLGLNLSPKHVLISLFSDLGQMLKRAT